MTHSIIIKHIIAQNANAFSSPYTIGFPAMTAWLGAVHKLQRLLQSDFQELRFTGVGVSCHRFNLHTYKGKHDFVMSIIGTGNPLTSKGLRQPFIEEARCNLDVSIAIRYTGIRKIEEKSLSEKIIRCFNTKMKIAGGDILSFEDPQFYLIDQKEDFERFRNQLMPGYVIIDRHQLMKEAMEGGDNAIEALLEYIKVYHTCTISEDSGDIIWNSSRKTLGWIVPIAVGFQGLTEKQLAYRQRDQNTPHRFAESIISLGEFIMPYRLKSLNDLFWVYRYEDETDLYLCTQESSITSI